MILVWVTASKFNGELNIQWLLFAYIFYVFIQTFSVFLSIQLFSNANIFVPASVTKKDEDKSGDNDFVTYDTGDGKMEISDQKDLKQVQACKSGDTLQIQIMPNADTVSTNSNKTKIWK